MASFSVPFWFEQVRQATHLLTSAQYAIKILDKHHLRTHKKEKYAQVEVEALKRLSTSSPSSATTRSAGPLKNNAPGKRLVKSASEQTVMDLPSRPPSANTAGERLKDVEKGKEKGRGGHPGVIKMFWAFQDVSSLCTSVSPVFFLCCILLFPPDRLNLLGILLVR